MRYQLDDTIAAIVTPPGIGGVAIVRISGKQAVAIAAASFSKNPHDFKSHTVHLGHVLNKEGAVDEALCLIMRAPNSFTGEDVIEFQCHGGVQVSKNVLDAVLGAGARMALPGEFSYRAFLNGKIDLAQAEAIQSLILSESEKSAKASLEQLQGKLSSKVMEWKTSLTKVAAIIEAWVDFPDEGLEFATEQELVSMLIVVKEKVDHLLSSWSQGKLLHGGVKLCLYGAPNVGKSSLMNALLEEDRVIVSSQAGTTRDIVEEKLHFNGLVFKIIDTAGIREASCHIEQEGIRRSRAKMQDADLILCLLDASESISDHDKSLLEEIPKEKTVLVWNKMDLFEGSLPQFDFPFVAHISAKTMRGIDDLKKVIEKVVWIGCGLDKSEVLLTNSRHKEALADASHLIQEVIDGLKQQRTPECIAGDMRACLIALGRIIGSDVNEDILNSIFSQFCIGK